MVGRVLWVLQEDFQILKIERKAPNTENHHKVLIETIELFHNFSDLANQLVGKFPAPVATVPALNDAVHERVTYLLDLQRTARKLVGVRERA